MGGKICGRGMSVYALFLSCVHGLGAVSYVTGSIFMNGNCKWKQVHQWRTYMHVAAWYRGTKVHKIQGISVEWPRPLALSNFIMDVWEKCYNFLHLQYFGASLAKVHQSWNWYRARPDLSICQISCRSDSLFTRYLLPNFVDFVWTTNKQTNTKQTTRLDIPCGDSNCQASETVADYE